MIARGPGRHDASDSSGGTMERGALKSGESTGLTPCKELAMDDTSQQIVLQRRTLVY